LGAKNETDREARRKLAAEVGLPDGWGAQFDETHVGTRRKFWDPDGNRYNSVIELHRHLGERTPQQLLELGAKYETDREARRKLATELGLPDGWGAQITETHVGKRRKFWDPDGNTYNSVIQLQKRLGDKTPQELLESTSFNGNKGKNDDAERLKLAREVGLPDGWGARFTQASNGMRRKFWDPAGNKYNSVMELQRHLGKKATPELLRSLSGIPKKGQSDEEYAAKSKMAADLGLPEGWLAYINERPHSVVRKFWDPEGNSYMSLAKLKDILGELPEPLQRVMMKKREKQTDGCSLECGRETADRNGKASPEKLRKKQKVGLESGDLAPSGITKQGKDVAALAEVANPSPSSPVSTSSSSSSSESSLQQEEPQQEEPKQEQRQQQQQQQESLQHSKADLPACGASQQQQSQQQQQQAATVPLETQTSKKMQSAADTPGRSASAGPPRPWIDYIPVRQPIQNMDTQQAGAMQTEDVWLTCWSEEYRLPYFWNKVTQEAVWEMTSSKK